jgi:hypothetical protein
MQITKPKEYENTTTKIHADFINGVLHLNISSLPSGVYFIKILTNKEQYVENVVLQ